MGNHSPIENFHDELERDAYNAAFFELGFRWHWGSATYSGLLRARPTSSERILHYLQCEQPHLLKAYDAAFLIDAIQKRQALHRKRSDSSGAVSSTQFDWAEWPGCELGA